MNRGGLRGRFSVLAEIATHGRFLTGPNAKEDGTFGNRFDDPMGVYRVLYASSQRLGYFIETLARFRVDVSFVADLALMETARMTSQGIVNLRHWTF